MNHGGGNDELLGLIPWGGRGGRVVRTEGELPTSVNAASGCILAKHGLGTHTARPWPMLFLCPVLCHRTGHRIWGRGWGAGHARLAHGRYLGPSGSGGGHGADVRVPSALFRKPCLYPQARASTFWTASFVGPYTRIRPVPTPSALRSRTMDVPCG